MFKTIAMLFGLVGLAFALLGGVAIFSLDNIQLSTTPLFTFLSEDNIVKFKLGISNIWLTLLRPGMVQLEYTIVKKDSGQIVEAKRERVSVRGGINFNRGLLLPPKTEGGKYSLTTTARYKSLIARSSFDFQVGAAPSKLDFADLELTAEDMMLSEGINLSADSSNVVEVTIRGYKAVPEKIIITPGTTIRWTNNDEISHTITGAGFDSGPVHKGGVFTFTFNESGLRYIYKSTIHHSILGEIIVKR